MRCKCISAPGGDGRICRGLLLLPSAGTASIPGRSVGEHTGPYLDLVVRWETITALYAERAFALAQIEVGHMLALLTEHLQSLGVAYYVKPADAVSPDEGALACRIHLGACAVTSPPQVSVDFSVMENEGAPVARASGRHYCLGETSVLAESSDVYGVLQSSQVLLQVHGAKNACHYQASGWMMQRFGAPPSGELAAFLASRRPRTRCAAWR